MRQVTRDRYTASCNDFEEWRQLQGRTHGTPVEADTALDAYFENLYLQGQPQETARYALYGLAWVRGWATGGLAFPLAKQNLKGWRCREPAFSRDPIPWEALVILCVEMLNMNTHISALCAAASILTFDAYLRPSETVSLTRANVVPPAGRGKYGQWAVIVAPSHSAVRPGKTGEYDDTVIVGDIVTDRQRLVIDVISGLWRRANAPEGALLDDLTLPAWESCMRNACRLSGLQTFTPHQLQHGGPSLDALQGDRDSAGIQDRGRWKSRSSVRRYQKHGVLLRVRRRFTNEQLHNVNATQASLHRRVVQQLKRYPPPLKSIL